jgi:hypothetical protein
MAVTAKQFQQLQALARMWAWQHPTKLQPVSSKH